MEQEVYSVNDFCARYAISRRSFYREIKANRLRFLKRGWLTFVAREDAEHWLQSQRQPPVFMCTPDTSPTLPPSPCG